MQDVVGAISLCAALLFSGCRPAPAVENTLEVAASPESSASTAAPDAANDAPPTDAPTVTRAKSIGHTSVVFKITFAGGSEAAFKPESHRGKARYRGEIAAYRLGQGLGLSNVPAALVRRFRATELRSVLAGESADLFDYEVVIDPNGGIRGAIIPWIQGLEFLPLSASNAFLEKDPALASQISTLIVFDVLTGNWDRWSGGNVGFDRGANRVLFIDNDGAFFDPVPARPAEFQIALLRKTEHFSRRFVTRLRSLTLPALVAVIGDEDPGVPLLSARVLEQAEKRRQRAISIIDAKIATRGETTVLSFE